MKVRVTFEISDTDRIAISVAQDKGFVPATRADIEAFLTGVVTNRLDAVAAAWKEITDELMAKIKL